MEEKASPEMIQQRIVEALPYGAGFLFVDEITEVSEAGITGSFEFRKELPWYQDHFPNHPVTPGVLLIECMAQIGLVSLGLYLIEKEKPGSIEGKSTSDGPSFLFSESNVLFSNPVFPGNKVIVQSTKKYWRLGKLKCHVVMKDANGTLIASGTLSGMRLAN